MTPLDSPALQLKNVKEPSGAVGVPCLLRGVLYVPKKFADDNSILRWSVKVSEWYIAVGWFYSGLTAFSRAILVTVQSTHPQKPRTALAASNGSYDDEGLLP
jgi:hypothetical protein